MGLCVLERFNTVDTDRSKLSHGYNANLIDLFQLQRGVVPHSSCKASCEFKPMPHCYRVMKVDLAIDNASDQAMGMLKDSPFVDLVLYPVTLELVVRRKVHSTQLGLDQQ